MKKYIIFPNADFKYFGWSKELILKGYSVSSNQKGFYPSIVFHLLKNIFSKKDVKAFVFRYLNDRRSIFKTIANFIADIGIVIVCKIKKIKIFWIAHNLDKESSVYHPRINFYRRNFINKHSNKVFVTDPLLMKHADKMGVGLSKIDWISFGAPSSFHNDSLNINLHGKIIHFKSKIKEQSKGKKLVVGICVSSPSPKCHHFIYSDSLITNCSNDQIQLALVLIGKFPDGREFDTAKSKVNMNKYILHIDDNFPVNEALLSPEIDFFYRTVNDWSVSYSVYVAASLGKPIVTNNVGFLPEMLTYYNLGFVIPPKKEDSARLINEFFENWNPKAAQDFIDKRSWRIGAQRLISTI